MYFSCPAIAWSWRVDLTWGRKKTKIRCARSRGNIRYGCSSNQTLGGATSFFTNICYKVVIKVACNPRQWTPHNSEIAVAVPTSPRVSQQATNAPPHGRTAAPLRVPRRAISARTRTETERERAGQKPLASSPPAT